MRNILGYLFCLLSMSSAAQIDSNQSKHEKVAGLRLHAGTIVIHTPSVKNVSGARPFGAELDFSKIDIDSSSYMKCNCYPRYGITLSYFDFDNVILGHGIMVSYFIEPSYWISRKLKFNIRAAAGLVNASNPFDSIKNIANKSYTTHLNPYLQVGIGVTRSVNQHLAIAIMGSFQHFSNGGYKEPNRGVNWVTGSLGFLYYQNSNFPKFKSSAYTGWRNNKIDIDAGILYVPAQGFNSKIMMQRKFLLGAFGQATKQYGKISALAAGIEMYYDKLESVSTSLTKRSPLQAGIQVGHVFIFNKVTFSQHVGVQILKAMAQAEDFYFRYGLSYKLSRHWQAGINLKAHSDNADFADFRVAFRF